MVIMKKKINTKSWSSLAANTFCWKFKLCKKKIQIPYFQDIFTLKWHKCGRIDIGIAVKNLYFMKLLHYYKTCPIWTIYIKVIEYKKNTTKCIFI